MINRCKVKKMAPPESKLALRAVLESPSALKTYNNKIY